MDPLYLALLLYVAALAMAVVDLFVPSGGMLLVLAALAAVGGVLFGFRSGSTAGMTMLTLVMGTIPVFVFLAIKIWPHTPIGKRIVLKLPSPDLVGDLQANDPLLELVGRVLLAETALLPTGQVRVGHRRFNAVAESGYVEAGAATLRVLMVRERNLVVRATEEALSLPAIAVSDRPPGMAPPTDIAADGTSLLDRPAEELGLESLDD